MAKRSSLIRPALDLQEPINNIPIISIVKHSSRLCIYFSPFSSFVYYILAYHGEKSYFVQKKTSLQLSEGRIWQFGCILSFNCQPFTLPKCKPWTKYFCRKGYTKIIGRAAIIVIAARIAVGVTTLDWVCPTKPGITVPD